MLDWLFNLFDRIAENVFWKTVVHNFHWVDWLVVIFAIVGILYGLRKGLMSELGGILEICIVIALTHEYYVNLQFYFRRLFSKLPEEPLPAVSFILAGSGIWFVVGFVASRLRKVVHTQMAPLLRLSGGAVLGVIHMLLICSFISQVILLMPIPSLKKSYEPGSSTFGAGIARMAPAVHHLITERSFQSSSEEIS